MSPGFGRKPPPLVWTHHSECRLGGNSFVHWRQIVYFMVEASSTTFAISCCRASVSVSTTASAVSYKTRLRSYSSRSAITGSRPASSGRVSTRRNRRATASGDALRYMIRPAGRKSSTDLCWVIQPPPGDRIIPLVPLSSSVSANSRSRKWSSPFSLKISRTSRPARRSISRSKSRNRRPSCRAAALPTVVFPTPGNPTRITCGADSPPSAPFSATEAGKVALEAAACFAQRITAEFFEECLREHESCHRFGNHSHRWNGGDIASFRDRLRGLAGLHLDRSKRPHQSAYWFHGDAEDDLLAVANPALQTAGPVATAADAAGAHVAFVGVDLVVDVGPFPSRRFDTEPDLDRFDGGNRHQCGGQPGIQLPVPRYVRAESDGHAVANDLSDAAERVSLALRGGDAGDHFTLGARVHATQ